MPSQEPVGERGLDVRDLIVRYGDTLAVDDVDLHAEAGRVLAVLGPSGCGKSTLLRAVAGLEPASSGTVCFDGVPVDGLPTHRRGFALMFQDGQLFAHQSVGRNIGYPLRLRHRPRAEAARRVTDLLDLVGLPGYADRMPDSLSGGERQRVALARALAVEPRLLLLDEPLSALDRGLRERLAADLRRILTEAGTTALFVTHDQEEAFAVADTMAVMREGRVVQSGSLDDVWANPVDAWTARFLGYAEVVEGAAARVLRDAVDPGASWTRLALRRSALHVDPAGPLQAEVIEARSTPEQVRLTLRIDGAGELAGVARTGTKVAPGTVVGVALDTGRAAVLRD